MNDEELYDLFYEKKSIAYNAFNELYDRYSTNIYTYCLKIMGAEEIAQDIFQETFTRFYESASKKRKMTNVAGFLIKIARNLCLNEKIRKYNDKVPLEEFRLPSYDQPYEKKEMNSILEMAIDSLPEKYKEVIILKEFLDMTYKEIAKTLDTTLPIVRIRIYRAKNKIREFMTPYIEDLDENN